MNISVHEIIQSLNCVCVCCHRVLLYSTIDPYLSSSSTSSLKVQLIAKVKGERMSGVRALKTCLMAVHGIDDDDDVHGEITNGAYQADFAVVSWKA